MTTDSRLPCPIARMPIGFVWFVPTAFGISDEELAAVIANSAAPAETKRVHGIIQGSAKRIVEIEVLTARGHQCVRPS